jgi:hypothetical protein
MVFRKEPFFHGHDNYDQLVKIAKARAARCCCRLPLLQRETNGRGGLSAFFLILA